MAVEAGILSVDEFRDKGCRTSQKRWEIVAALHEIIDKSYIKRVEDDTQDHIRLDQWNFHLTPQQGKDYASQLLSKGCEEHSISIGLWTKL